MSMHRKKIQSSRKKERKNIERKRVRVVVVVVVTVLVFYGLSTLFRSFRARSVNLSTLFLANLPRQFTST